MAFRFRFAFIGRSLGACAWLATAMLVLIASPTVQAGGPAGTIRLSDGGSMTGELLASPDAGTIRWQGKDFTQPFDFASSAVAAIQIPIVRDVKPAGSFALELVSGDLLHGDLIRMDGQETELDAKEGGRLVVKTSAVKRLYRLEGDSGVLYQGPTGLTGWTQSGPENAWTEDGPNPVTVQHGATLTRDVLLPEESAIELQLAWDKTPSFVLALGMDPDAKEDHRQHGFRFEVWDGDLVVVRENADRADAAFIRTLTKETKHLQLTVYLSQTRGELQVYGPDGKRQASIKVPPAAPKKSTGIRLINVAGDIRLENLRVTRLRGAILDPLAEGQARLRKADGTTLDGKFASLDGATGEFVFQEADKEVRIANKDLAMLEFAPKVAEERREMTVFCQDGSRFSGRLESIDAEHLTIVTPDVRDPIRVSLPSLRTMALASGEKAPAAATAQRSGRLEIDRHKLFGKLLPGANQGEGSCLVWQPDASRTASPVRIGTAGRIVYRDPPPPVPKTTARTRTEPQGNFASIFLRNLSQGAPPKAATRKPQTLHLISGDTIPCTVASITEEGLTIDTPLASAQVVPHAQVKALELKTGAPAPSLKNAKKDRLLTIPRLQKGSPPTHLLCSANGDFLRCRLIDMTDVRIRVEIQLENVDIPRDRVAQIIWFHPEPEGKGEPKTDSATPAVPEVTLANWPLQVLRRDGNRVTFIPESVDDKLVTGTSTVLGACRFALADADQLIFGKSVDLAAAELAYHQWKLHPAIEPLVAQDLGDGPGEGRPTGTESLLVGKPAPDFQLDLLTGQKFRLADCKGQIVILDFWATWCGPCMQTMPLVEKAMEEFDPGQVRLVTVNLEEPAQNVKAVLERHKMNVTVALDEDGVTARKYEANAIPQTVIVDREGKVHRLFVGGGPAMVEELTGSIRTLLGTAQTKTAPEEPAKGT